MKALITSTILLSAALLFLASDIPAASDTVFVKKVTATSTLEPSKATYRSHNLMDQTSSSWCEGKKDDGIGQSVTIHLEKKKRITSLYIKNGFGLKKYFKANNRVKSLLVNGTPHTLKDTGNFQTLKLKKAITTDTLILKIASVYRGAKYRDTCIAEVSLTAQKKNSFGKSDGFHKLTKQYATDIGMPGDVVYFNRDYTVLAEAVPCGDESCPMNYHATCKRVSAGNYDCHYIEYCYGKLIDHKNWKVKRVCEKLQYIFKLKIKNGKPVIIHKGKTATLKPFD